MSEADSDTVACGEDNTHKRNGVHVSQRIKIFFFNVKHLNFYYALCTVFQVRRIAARSSHEQEM